MTTAAKPRPARSQRRAKHVTAQFGNVRASCPETAGSVLKITLESIQPPEKLASTQIDLNEDAAIARAASSVGRDLRDDAATALMLLARQMPVFDATDFALPKEYTEDALAAEFSVRHADRYRFTAAWGKWHEFDGALWREDGTLRVYDRVRVICREFADRSDNEKVSTVLSRANTIAAVERLARSDRRHAMSANDWDRDPMLLGTPAGTVDLRSGELRPSRSTDYISRSTATVPEKRPADLWTRFLTRITGGDDDLRFFLQRVAGYCLTGDIREHALFFLYGTGGNGKGTFVNTLQRVLGDYAKVAPIETFTASKNDQHPTDRAMLRGARLVASQETEEGRRWAESKVKAMTGGDPITARFMRGDFFTYRPGFKLVIAGNHKPQLSNVDAAMRRRLHLVPFTQQIPPSEIVRGLEEMLADEWPAILHWAIQGCLLWQEIGLRPPASVQDATTEYFEAEDVLQQWLDECCDHGDPFSTPASALLQSWQIWCERNGQWPGSQKTLGERLVSRGFEKGKVGGVRSYFKLRLRPSLVTSGTGARGEHEAAS